MRRDHLGDLLGVGLDAHLLVERHLPQLGDQPGVVLGGEERGVDAEHLGDAQQHRHGQRPDVVLDLVQVARRDLQGLGERGLAQSPFGAQLAQAGADEGLGHSPRVKAGRIASQRLVRRLLRTRAP